MPNAANSVTPITAAPALSQRNASCEARAATVSREHSATRVVVQHPGGVANELVADANARVNSRLHEPTQRGAREAAVQALSDGVGATRAGLEIDRVDAAKRQVRRRPARPR